MPSTVANKNLVVWWWDIPSVRNTTVSRGPSGADSGDSTDNRYVFPNRCQIGGFRYTTRAQGVNTLSTTTAFSDITIEWYVGGNKWFTAGPFDNSDPELFTAGYTYGVGQAIAEKGDTMVVSVTQTNAPNPGQGSNVIFGVWGTWLRREET